MKDGKLFRRAVVYISITMMFIVFVMPMGFIGGIVTCVWIIFGKEFV